MSRRKSDSQKLIPIEALVNQDPPEWNDVLRGILIALVEQRRAMWDGRFRTTKERSLQLCREIALILSNQDGRMNEWAVLEKWCWMMEMYTRACEKPDWNWRYRSAMSFLSSFIGNGTQYLGCLSNGRLVQLTERYAVEDEERKACRLSLVKRAGKKTVPLTGCFLKELEKYQGCESRGTSADLLMGNAMEVDESSSGRNTADKREVSEEAEVKPLTTRTRSARLATGHSSGSAGTSAPTTPKAPSSPKSSPEEREKSVNSSVPTTLSDVLRSAFCPPNATSMMKPAEVKQEDAPAEKTVYIPTEQEAFPLANPRADIWTRELMNALIEGVKNRPCIWHSQHPHYKMPDKRNDAFTEVSAILRKIRGGENMSADGVAAKWALLHEAFNRHQKKERAGVTCTWEFYPKLQFLTPQVMSAYRFYANGDPSATVQSAIDEVNHGMDVENRLKQLFGYFPKEDGQQDFLGSRPPPAKRCREASRSPPNILKKKPPVAPPHIVATWVPPREDSIAAALQTMASPTSSAVTATAQIVSTSNDSLSSLLNMELANSNGKLTDNGVDHQLTEDRKPERRDKWRLMGELIEQTCREMEAQNPVLALRLQKDISDVVFKYQMENLEKK